MNKVLVVTPWLEGGGAQRALVGILRRIGSCQVTVVALFDGCSNFDEVESCVHEVELWNNRRSPLGTLTAARQLRKFIKSKPFDSYYSLLRAGSIVISLSGALPWMSDRLVVSIHQDLREDACGLKGRFEEVFHARTLRAAALVTSPSADVVKYVRQRYSVPAGSAVIEKNILDLEVGSALPQEFAPNDELRLLFCGRITEQKGLDRLIDALRSVERPVFLKIAGDGDCRSDLEDQAKRCLPSQHTIEFVGRIEPVWNLIDWSHLAVMPSRSELEPVFVWEAWARQRAVLASDIPAFVHLQSLGPIFLFDSCESLSTWLSLASSSYLRCCNVAEDAERAVSCRNNSQSAVASFLMTEGSRR